MSLFINHLENRSFVETLSGILPNDRWICIPLFACRLQKRRRTTNNRFSSFLDSEPSSSPLLTAGWWWLAGGCSLFFSCDSAVGQADWPGLPYSCLKADGPEHAMLRELWSRALHPLPRHTDALSVTRCCCKKWDSRGGLGHYLIFNTHARITSRRHADATAGHFLRAFVLIGQSFNQF